MSGNTIDLAAFGPLAQLFGVWEGNQGKDISPGEPDIHETHTEHNFKERWDVSPVTPHTENHHQKLKQAVFLIDAWRGTPSTAGKNAGQPFHGEKGFMIWDKDSGMLLNSFAVPRGIVINAGCTIAPDATEFELVADAGSDTFGIAQSPFLMENFKVVRVTRKIRINGDGTLDYEQNTLLDIKGRGLMDHIDTNHMVRKS